MQIDVSEATETIKQVGIISGFVGGIVVFVNRNVFARLKKVERRGQAQQEDIDRHSREMCVLMGGQLALLKWTSTQPGANGEITKAIQETDAFLREAAHKNKSY